MDDKTSVLKPYMPSDPLMAGPWVAALSWAIGEDDMLAEFRADTGNDWTPGRTPLERMIDEATGADAEFITQFAEWFNANVWGDVNLRHDGTMEGDDE